MSDTQTAPTAQRRRRVAPFVALAVTVVIGALFVVLASAKSGADDSSDSDLLGKPAPRVVTTTLDGKPFDLSQRKGSWVVLNFFNSTCIPCLQEHPELVAFAEQQAGIPDGAELYTVMNADRDDAVRSFFADNGGDWPVLKDDPGTIYVSFGVSKVPETWVISPDGIVVARYTTTVTASGLGAQIQKFREGIYG